MDLGLQQGNLLCLEKAPAISLAGAGRVGDPPRKPLELWIADVETGISRCLLSSPDYGLNGVFDECAPMHCAHMLGNAAIAASRS